MEDFKRLFSGGYDYSANGETPGYRYGMTMEVLPSSSKEGSSPMKLG